MVSFSAECGPRIQDTRNTAKKMGEEGNARGGGRGSPRGVAVERQPPRCSCREALGVSSARFRAVASFSAEMMWPWNKRHTTRNGGGRSRARRGERTAPHGVAVELERR